MAWQDRISEAAYTSPSGVRTVFEYANVSIGFDKKTAAFEFPDVNGTYVQDLGKTGLRIGLRLFFSGNNYDLVADNFLLALGEKGIGRLEHPKYGQSNVVPFGSITRRDDLVTAANQAVFEVTFWETITTAYPKVSNDRGAQVLTALNAYNEDSAFEINRDVLERTASETLAFRQQFQSGLDQTRLALQDVTEITTGANPVTAIFNALNRVAPDEEVTILVGGANQLIQVASRSGSTIPSLLDTLEGVIASRTSNIRSDGLDAAPDNRFLSDNIFAAGCLAGMIVGVVEGEFKTKPEALETAERVLTQFETLSAWQESNYSALNRVDTGAAYQKLQDATALAAGFLVDVSFTLQTEFRLVTSRPRNILELCAEVYQSVDNEILDFFIESNRFTGSEILEIPRGREIVYYV